MENNNNIVDFPALPHGSCYVCAHSPFDLGLESLAECQKCKRTFCPEHASKINPSHCEECFSDVVVTDKTYIKTEVEYDEIEDCLVEYKRGCRKINFAGADWVFYTKAIHQQTDEELARTFEFHRAIVSQLETEITQRKIDKLATLRKTSAGTIITVNRKTETTTTKTTKQKTIDINKLAAQLFAKGVTPEQLLSVLGVQAPKPAPPQNKKEGTTE